MNFLIKNIKIFIHRSWIFFIPAIICCNLTSCFTGIESTKKIHLSREDKKLANPSPEERFMNQIIASPLKDWDLGKDFYVTDDKALLIIVPQEGLRSTPPDSIKGKILKFQGVESKMNAAGQLIVALAFTDDTYIYAYNTGKEFNDAMENLKSDQIPMLIDLAMVNETRNLLQGQKFWSRSPLWYDITGERINGKRFVPVTITDVTPGNNVFPLQIQILTEEGETAYMYMNYGNEDNESRAFANLFSFTDIRKRYPNIDNETWQFISEGKVKVGMTKEEVKLALGNPSDLNSGHDYSQTLDIWRYDNGQVLWFEDGRLVKIRR